MAEFALVVGHRGGGKSYFVTELMAKAARDGAIVHTNMNLLSDRWKEFGLWDKIVVLDEDRANWLKQLQYGEEGRENVMVIDEAMFAFHVHNQVEARKQNEEMFTMMVMGRKLGLDCYFVTHSADNIDVAMRRMADVQIRCKDMRKTPMIGWWFVGPPVWFKPFAWLIRWKPRWFARERWSGNGKTFFTRSYTTLDPIVGSLYRTDDTMGKMANITRNVTREKKVDESQQAGKKKLLFTLLIVLVGMCWTGYVFAGALFGKHPKPTIGAHSNAGGASADSSGAPGAPSGERSVAAVVTVGGVPRFWLSDGSSFTTNGYFEGEQIRAVECKSGGWQVTTDKNVHQYKIASGAESHQIWQKLHTSQRSVSALSSLGHSPSPGTK